jgi:photosystem II stability/assembly factor-like uncharacterized protein
MRQLKPSVWFWATLVLGVGACHREAPEDIPLFERQIGVPDKFYDVHAFDANRAIVVGYAGKILFTPDSGATWEVIHSGTNRALYSVEFVDDQNGWITGQDGVILHTGDGGKTWARQQSGTVLYLFDVAFLDAKEGWVIGDKATYLHTADGGRTWRAHKMARSAGLSAEEALVAQDPVLYDVQFLDKQRGWVVGEFGKIYHTADGGATWREQQESLLGSSGLYDVLDLPTFFGVHFSDAQNGLAAGLEGRIARTRDGGATWRFEEFDNEGIPLTDPLFRPLQFPDTTAWAVGAAGEVLRQSVPGAPWKRAQLGMELVSWLRAIEFHDANNGWIVGGYGMILHTTDGGKTWLPCLG